MADYLEFERKLVPADGRILGKEDIGLVDGFSMVGDVSDVFTCDRYFDGKNYPLARARIGLRVRRGGRILVMTLKKEVTPGDISERLEVNHDMEDVSPADLENLDVLDEYPARPIYEARIIVGNDVNFRYVLGVNSYRRVIPIRRGGVYADLSVETSFFANPNGKIESASEVEIEFNRDRSTSFVLETAKRELAGLSGVLCEQYGLVPNPDSKYLRGLKMHGLI